MRARALYSLVGALIAAVALVSASGAATSKAQKVARIDVSTRAAVVHYLHSIHVNAKGAVIERGFRNYAGAHCPGMRWTCASTRHTVVQIARRGGQNRFVCRSSRCAVVQFSGVSRGVYIAGRRLASTSVSTKGGNSGTCIKTTGLGASCSITQPGGGTALIWEDAGKLTGLTQTALYTASITQTSGSVANVACVHQSINIDGSTKNTSSSGATVTLEAHQSIIIRQNSASGDNTAENAIKNQVTGVYQCDSSALSQNQQLTSTATSKGPITQNEDKALIACPDGVSGDNANLCLEIDQNQGISGASGTNSASFDQESTQNAIANTSGAVSQTQSSICPGSCPAPGGLVGTVNQDSTGVSTAKATQNETQCEDAATRGLTSCDTADPDHSEAPSSLTQTQYGPVGVGKLRNRHRGRVLYGHLKGLGMATQTGSGADMFTINQTSTQDTDQGTGSTQQNFGKADCKTSGNCTATQKTNINGTQDTNTQSGSNVDTSTNCTGSSCTSTCNNTSCTTFTQSGAQLTATDTEVKEFGYGGMRASTGTNNVGDGSGSIAVSGITGPVSKALLYWNGPETSGALNSPVSFAGQSVSGNSIGIASSNCWPYDDSQSYEADVTTLVAAGLTGGSGTFNLANFIKSDESGVTADINGVALVVFYNDGNAANWRNVVLWSGNDSNVAFGSDSAGWDETLTGVTYPGSGSASLDFIVGDGQNTGTGNPDDGAISVNGTQIVPAGAIFEGASTPHGPADASGDLWDVESFPLTSDVLTTLSTTGPNPLEVTSPLVSDCLSLVAVAANMPASAPPPVLQAPIAPVQKQAGSPLGQAPAAVSAFGGGGGLIRRK